MESTGDDMGNLANISLDVFPRQGRYLGKRVAVCFHYDTTRTVLGTIVRDDAEAPWRLIISLDSGRVVLAEECQYTPVP